MCGTMRRSTRRGETTGFHDKPLTFFTCFVLSPSIRSAILKMAAVETDKSQSNAYETACSGLCAVLHLRLEVKGQRSQKGQINSPVHLVILIHVHILWSTGIFRPVRTKVRGQESRKGQNKLTCVVGYFDTCAHTVEHHLQGREGQA